jgi:hypothetical protein
MEQGDHWEKVVKLIRLANDEREVRAQLKSGNPYEVVKALEKVELSMDDVNTIREELDNVIEVGVIW